MVPDPVLARMFHCTCALGLFNVPPSDVQTNEVLRSDLSAPYFDILGTGFLVRGSTILTNRHVAEAMKDEWSKRPPTYNPVHAQFTYPAPDGSGMCQTYTKLSGNLLTIGNPDADLAMLDMPVSDESARNLRPVSVIPTVDQIVLGEDVAVLGFPYGSYQKAGLGLRGLGPLLQQGHVSGFSPWQRSKVMNELLLDVRTIGGMSGSPVFRRETGEVIGIIHGGIAGQFVVGQTQIDVPHFVVAQAVPLDERRLSMFFQVLDSGQTGLVSGKVDYADDGGKR